MPYIAAQTLTKLTITRDDFGEYYYMLCFCFVVVILMTLIFVLCYNIIMICDKLGQFAGKLKLIACLQESELIFKNHKN